MKVGYLGWQIWLLPVLAEERAVSQVLLPAIARRGLAEHLSK